MNHLRITFDTNAANLIADPAQYSNLDIPLGTAKKIRCAILAGRITGFVSEASVFVECLSFSDKLDYLALAGREGPRPVPDPRRMTIFETLAGLGIRMLHAPLIAAETFIELPWAADERVTQTDRQNRFSSFISPYSRHEPLRRAGEASLNIKPLTQRIVGMSPGRVLARANDWTLAFKRDWDEGGSAERESLRKQIGPLFAEWCDILIVGSHYAYGNDFFCTTDKGKGAGANSLLHHSNRANLASQNINVVSPQELVSIVDTKVPKRLVHYFRCLWRRGGLRTR